MHTRKTSPPQLGTIPTITESLRTTCRLCEHTEFTTCVEIYGMPHSMQWTSEAVVAENTDETYRLETCNWCGLLQNRTDLDVDELNESFSVNVSSTKNEPHIDAELDLIFAHTQPRQAVDVGCNDGRFLAALRDRGITKLLGIEPTAFAAECARGAGFTIFEGLADAATAPQLVEQHGRFDLVITRQVVEHLAEFPSFFAALRELCTADGYLFIDVPDMDVAYAHGDCTILWQEHLSFFTETSLLALLAREGFSPVAIGRYDVSGGTIGVLARRALITTSVARSEAPSAVARAYGKRVRENARILTEYLRIAQSRGYEVVVYGTMRSTMLLNGMRMARHVSYIVDDQAHRQGKYFPGTDLRIFSSTELSAGDSPLVCLLAVSHQSEAAVRSRLRENLTRECIVVGVCGPGDLDGEISALGAWLGVD